MQTIEEFVDRLVTEKGFDTKDVAVVDQIKADLLDSISDQVDAMIMGNIPVDKLDEFDAVLDTDDKDKIGAFVRSVVPDIDQKTAGVLLKVKNTYLA